MNTVSYAPYKVDKNHILSVAQKAHDNQSSGTSDNKRLALINRIKQLLIQRDAVLISHYYTDPDIQQLTEETGGHVADSLEMARFGNEHPAKTLVVAGVKFMGETAKILKPEKTVLMPDLNAECSLDLECPIQEFSDFCQQHPDRKIVVYSNTSIEVKAKADWVVTSGIALKIIRHLHQQGEQILWAPDKYLGHYIQKETQADMILWPGSCIVHEEFKATELSQLKITHPDAAILVHPESPESVIELADVVGSTSALIKATQTLNNQKFIVATDRGIFYKMQQLSPNKTFMEAPNAGIGATCKSCAHCPWMGLNHLESLEHVLESNCNEIIIDENLRQQAMISINRMMHFSKQQNINMTGKGNA